MRKIGWITCSTKAGTPTGQQLAWRDSPPLPDCTSALRVRSASLTHGWRIGASGLPCAIVGWRPVARYSSLVTRGKRGSCCTGPAPDFGGLKSVESEIQPTEGLGENTGGAAARASDAQTA